MATIRQIREDKGLTQDQVASRAKVSANVISRLENGHSVNYSTIERVCEVLGVSPDAVEGLNIARRKRNV